MKKILTTILILSMILSIPSIAVQAAIFTDIDGHWAQANVEAMTEAGYLSGYPDGTFRPDEPVTRAEFAKIICEVYDLPTSEYGWAMFDDVNEGDWYAPYVPAFDTLVFQSFIWDVHSSYMPVSSLAKRLGEDYGTLFGAEVPMTRVETVGTIMSCAEFPDDDGEEYDSFEESLEAATAPALLAADSADFSDNATVPFIMGLAMKRGIITGDDQGRINPYGTLSRAELCTLLSRVASMCDGSSDYAAERISSFLSSFEGNMQMAEDSLDVMPDEAGEIPGSLYPVKKGGLYGYINEQGEMVIGPEFGDASRFYEGYAAVKKGGLYGYIDKAGNLAVPCQFDEVKKFSEGKAAVKKDGKWGYINTAGDIIITCKFYNCGSFSQGRALIVKETDLVWPQKYYGFIDETGAEVIPCKYTQAKGFSDGLAWVTSEDESDAHFIDLNGNSVFTVQYSTGSFSEGFASEYISRANRYCFIDTSGKEITGVNYLYVSPFSEGLAVVSENTQFLARGEYYYINSEGENAFGNKTFAKARSFCDGYAYVEFGSKDGSSGMAPPYQYGTYIDHTGEFATDKIFWNAGDFCDGFAEVNDVEFVTFEDITYIRSSDKRKLINRNFDIVWEFED